MACRTCGTPIQQATADRNEGQCLPCARGQVTRCRECGARCLRSASGVPTGGLCARCRIEAEKRRPTGIRAFVAAAGEGGCPLLVRLFDLDQRLRGESRDRWIGLNLVDPPRPYGMDVTPRNAVAFAETGGEDVHFSLVTTKGRVSDASAVVLTVPSAGGTPWDRSFLVAESLHDFLCLGCASGYAHLEQLAYDWEGTVADLEAQAEAEGMEDTLQVYREELGLEPPASPRATLLALERRKRFVLQFGTVRGGTASSR